MKYHRYLIGLCIGFLLFCLPVSALGGDDKMESLGTLSDEERAWLAEHPTIRFTGDPDWLPQEAFTSEGQYVGIVADILDLIEARLGILFERVPVKTWDEAVRLAETADIGDIAGLNAIAAELLPQGGACKPLSQRIAQLAGDFNFEGALAAALEDPDGAPQ